MHHPTDRITHTTAFVTPVVEHWLEREIAQWVHTMKDRSDDPSHHEPTLYLWATSRSLVERVIVQWREGRKEMFSLLERSTNFMLQFYGVGYMDYSDNKRGNPLPPLNNILFLISSKGSFICTIPQTGYHTTVFVVPVVEHWLERGIAQWVHHVRSIRRPSLNKLIFCNRGTRSLFIHPSIH